MLRLLGVPFVNSPGEAEAQCAVLEELGLVDGVVTEDSDVLLFGAKNVYRNLFDQKKYVERYRAEDIQQQLGLDKHKLQHLAMLLGSDYTDGVKGIGIVNATEVLNAFPEEGGLVNFRLWVYSGSKEVKPALVVDATASEEQQTAQRQAYRRALFKYKHRNIRSSWEIGLDFPDLAVIKAYNTPNVDPSEEQFSWGEIHEAELAEFFGEKLGWTAAETHMHLKPVLGSMQQPAQTRLDGYYYGPHDEAVSSIASARVQLAVYGLTRKEREEGEQERRLAESRKRKRKEEDAAEGAGLATAGGDGDADGARSEAKDGEETDEFDFELAAPGGLPETIKAKKGAKAASTTGTASKAKTKVKSKGRAAKKKKKNSGRWSDEEEY
jgi:DNA excision repair protein ERCC-5